MLIYISDYFVDEVMGGSELNDQELLKILESRNHIVKKYKSSFVTKELIEKNKNCFFIISNFIQLSQSVIESLYNKKYIIYEHDHKYVSTRNPALYNNFLCPKHFLVNLQFYKNAKAVLCQSNFHKHIINKNLNLDNIISVGGNLWSIEHLEYMKNNSLNIKNNVCSIMDSNIAHKNTIGAINYCNTNKLQYSLIKSHSYYQFLNLLGANKYFCFLPKTPETLSRVVVEARMMGVTVITNKLLGATSEEWFTFSGTQLVDVMYSKREEIATTIENLLK